MKKKRENRSLEDSYREEAALLFQSLTEKQKEEILALVIQLINQKDQLEE